MMKNHKQLILAEPEIEETQTYFRHPNITLIIHLTKLMVQLQDDIVKKNHIIAIQNYMVLLLCFNF